MPLLVISIVYSRNTFYILVYLIRFVNFFRRMEERFENKTNASIFEAFLYLLLSLADLADKDVSQDISDNQGLAQQASTAICLFTV